MKRLLQYAAKCFHVFLLLQICCCCFQVNDDFNGITALLAASFHKSVEAVRLLIQHGANLESKVDKSY